MFSSKAFIVGVLLIAPLQAVQMTVAAQSKLDSTQVLNEVTVQGDRYREVIPSQRLSGEKLEALSSFSVADAIRYFSGVQIKDYGGIGGLKTVDIRSMGTNHLGVFYDGIEIGNAQNGTVDLGKFSLDNIEVITLYNGQKSEIFQSAKDFGSAGTIYLRTRQPKFTGDKKTNIKTFFRSGSFGLVNPSVLWEQKLGRDGKGAIYRAPTMSVNAEYIYSSGKYPFRYRKVQNSVVMWDTAAVRHNGDIHSLRLESSLNGLLEQGKWHAKAYFYNSEKGLPGAIVDNVWFNPQRQWDRNFFVQGSFQKQIFKNYEIMANVKYSSDCMRYLNKDTIVWDNSGSIAFKTMFEDNRFAQQEIYASFVNKYSIFPNWDVNLSVDYIWNTLDANLTNFVYPVRNTVLTALATAFEWRRLKAQASVLGTFVFDRTKYGYAPADKQEYTPAVFLSYQPFAGARFIAPLRLRAFYKHIFRMPTFNDLYYTDIGSIALKPEYTTQYNVGFQYENDFKRGIVNRINFRADAYYNQVIDKIVATPKGGSGSGGLYRWTMENLGRVEIRGVDVSGQITWKLPADIFIHTNLNYTYQKAQNLTPPKNSHEAEFYGGQINYIPWHSGSAIVYAQWRSWDLNYSFIYVGERYHNSANIRANYERPWYTHDMTVGKKIVLRRRGAINRAPTMKISAEINNIFNQQYEVITCYPMPGTNFKIILKIEI